MNAALSVPTFRAPVTIACAWCDEEQGITRLPHTTSHTICLAHMASNLMEFSGKDDFDTLYWSVLAAIANGRPQ